MRIHGTLSLVIATAALGKVASAVYVGGTQSNAANCAAPFFFVAMNNKTATDCSAVSKYVGCQNSDSAAYKELDLGEEGSTSMNLFCDTTLQKPLTGVDYIVAVASETDDCSYDKALYVAAYAINQANYPSEWMNEESTTSYHACIGGQPAYVYKGKVQILPTKCTKSQWSNMYSSHACASTLWPGAGYSTSVSAPAVSILNKTIGFSQAKAGEKVPVTSDLSMVLNAESSLEVAVQVLTSGTDAAKLSSGSLGVFYKFEATGSGAINTTLVHKYDANLVQTLNYTESQLKWAYYDTSAGKWQILMDSTVDVNNKTVAYSTNHFSEWTIVASAEYSSAFPAMRPGLLFIGGALIMSAFLGL